MSHKLNAERAKDFMVGGEWARQNATFTIVSVATGARYTFKVCAPREQDETRGPVLFVKVLTGPSNESDYSYLGMVKRDDAGTAHFFTTKATRFTEDATCLKAFRWAFPRIAAGQLPDALEFWHEGKCCRCGRKLTDPESIESGIGPICATR
jgi:hypothetical protein